MSPPPYKIRAIDAIVNIWTEEAMRFRPKWSDVFFRKKIGVDDRTAAGISLEEMLRRMDAAAIEKAFLVATKAGALGPPACYHLPCSVVADAVRQYPDRFCGLAGIDPTEGMKGVRQLQIAVEELGFIGAHSYPHWFEIPPDGAQYYPFYAKCVELDIPIQLQVGQSLVYAPDYPRRSVGRPIALDSVACHFPELKLIGIHLGVPWVDEMIAMAWKHKNVFIGTDAHSPKYWPPQFVQFANTFGRKKVIFGTDFPVLDFERTRREIEELKLRSESELLILRENVRRVYKLD